MADYKVTLGFITIAIAVISYGFYFKGIFFGHTKPQPFSWFVWSVLSAIAFAALAALIIWRYTSDPNIAVILVSLAFALGFVPTFFKSYNKPGQETAVTFALNSVKFDIAVIALNSFSVASWLYPTTLFVLNGTFALFLLARRRELKIA